jgi:hypothetical protein
MCIFGVLGVKPNTNKVFLFTARGIKPRAIIKNLYSRNPNKNYCLKIACKGKLGASCNQ